MADITTAMIKELRERTGIGLVECKKAIIEARGNIELAIDTMRKSGQLKAAKKAARVAADGVILIKTSHDDKYGAIVELNCETDFVTQDNMFKVFGNEVINTVFHKKITNVEELRIVFEEKRVQLVAKIGENINIRRLGILENGIIGSYLHGVRIGVLVSAFSQNENLIKDKNLIKQIAMHIAASKPEYVSADNVPKDVMSREYQIQSDIAMKSGKTNDITNKIVEGRMRRFTNEISLISQYFILDTSKTVGQLLKENAIKINKFIRFEVGEGVSKNKI